MTNYKNAREILPEHLIKEIQKYARGIHLYIPKTEREGWGTSNGVREVYDERNQAIYYLYVGGVSINELADLYNLSEERVRNIIYEKQREQSF